MSDLFIVGASARAAAASALRAGFRPWCVDLFGDEDLVRVCPTRTVPLDGYAQAMMRLLGEGPPGPWMYTGGLENYPTIYREANRRLWGNPRAVVERVREPVWFDCMRQVGVRLPRLAGEAAREGAGEGVRETAPRWLLKPRRGSGGLDVRFWKPGESFDRNKYYLQEFISGIPASAVFIGIERGTALVGASRQLIGTAWLHATRPFQYAGSIGPFRNASLLGELELLGQIIGPAFGLLGLFGVDFIYDGAHVWPVEVNPRYPASVEILERASGHPVLADHAAVFDPDLVSKMSRTNGVPQDGSHGKAILFAEHDIVFPKDGPWMAAFDHHLADVDMPFADIPAPGQTIARGDPVLTFFARGETASDCENELRKIAADLDRVLFRR